MRIRLILGLAAALLSGGIAANAQPQTAPAAPNNAPPSVQIAPPVAPNAGPNAGPNVAPQTPQLTEAQWLAKARALKAKRDYKGAREAVYSAMDAADDYSPQASYLLGWLDVAQGRQTSAITNFRIALSDGLKGKEAVEARAALKRMGASEAFPPIKQRRPNIASMFMQQALMADLMRPKPLEWAIETALVLVAAAIGWTIITLLISWASKQRFGVADLKTVAIWVVLLLLLRALGQFAISFRHILPLSLAYLALATGQFGAALFYGVRRWTTGKTMDKGAIMTWGVFFTLLFLVFAGGSTPWAPYFIGLALAGAAVWVLINPWFLAGQRAEARKRKGAMVEAAAIYQKSLERPRLSDKTRFVLNNDLASLHAAMGHFERSIAHSQEALLHVHAFKSAEVMPRLNMAEALMSLGRTDESLDQLAFVWQLSETKDCIMGGEQWRGIVHGMLANLNFWRGWHDEAVQQAEHCLAAFPQEKRAGQSNKNLVAMSRAIKGLALLHKGEVEAGRRYLESAPKVAPKRDALAFVQFALSQMHERMGDLPTALQHAQAALVAAPGYFPAQLQQADLLAQSGHKAEAIAQVNAILPPNANHSLAPLARHKLAEWQAPVSMDKPAPPPAPPAMQPALAGTRTII